jgi:predicted nucleic acid-binding protein
MILLDTSIWIEHFRQGIEVAGQLAARADIYMHPYVLMEISLGSLPDRRMTLRFLRRLLPPVLATSEDLAAFIEEQRLYSSGLSFVDVHLLASARLTEDCLLWTRDRRLAEAALRLGVLTDPG